MSTRIIPRKLVQVLTPSTASEGNLGPDPVHLLAIKEVKMELEKCSTVQKWPELWPKRLVSVKPQSVSADTKTSKKDTEKWSEIVSDVYLERLAVNWSSVRNVMDMNAGFGGSRS
ncbi:probable methyltransferase PMT23 [Brassica rapa]|nr:probable methyltransferase PMT23 [Brassica rapa]